MKSNRRLSLGLLLICLPLTHFGQTTYFSNLGEASDSSREANSYTWLASGFHTDSSAGTFELDSVVLNMSYVGSPGGNLVVGIYSSTDYNLGGWEYPYASLETLSGETDPSIPGDLTFTSTGLILQADTTYWLVTGVSSGSGSYAFSMTNSGDFSAPSGWTIPDMVEFNRVADSSTGATNSWSSFSAPGMHQFSITATATGSAVPEPSTYAAILGGFALGFVAWRRRRPAAG